MEHFVGVEVGPNLIRASVYSAGLIELGKARRSTKLVRGPSAVIGRIARCAADAVDESDLALDQISGVGVAFPGSIEDRSELLATSPLLGWEKRPVQTELAELLGRPVCIGNDHQLRALAAFQCDLSGRGSRVAGIFWDTDFGGGLLVGGHWAEQEAAHRFQALVEATRREWRARLPSEMRDWQGRDLRKALKKGHDGAVGFVREVSAALGQFIAQLSALNVADVVILGGAVMEERKSELLAGIQGCARAQVAGGHALSLEVRASLLGDAAALVGAAVLARRCSETVLESEVREAAAAC